MIEKCFCLRLSEVLVEGTVVVVDSGLENIIFFYYISLMRKNWTNNVHILIYLGRLSLV
jgi:hypothetical protein